MAGRSTVRREPTRTTLSAVPAAVRPVSARPYLLLAFIQPRHGLRRRIQVARHPPALNMHIHPFPVDSVTPGTGTGTVPSYGRRQDVVGVCRKNSISVRRRPLHQHQQLGQQRVEMITERPALTTVTKGCPWRSV